MGVYYTMPVTSGFGNSGVPDLLCCHKGKFIAIECKANGNKPTRLQVSHMEAIRHAGGVALIIDETNVGSLRQLLESSV